MLLKILISIFLSSNLLFLPLNFWNFFGQLFKIEFILKLFIMLSEIENYFYKMLENDSNKKSPTVDLFTLKVLSEMILESQMELQNYMVY